MNDRIVIVGASLAGLSAAEALRESHFAGPITVIGDEPHMPYDRPPLSKAVLAGKAKADGTTLPRKLTLDEGSVDWRLGSAASGVNLAEKRISLENGDRVPFDKLLIATGSRARPWHVEKEAKLKGVVTLRGRDDAGSLVALLAKKPERVLIIGGGFMGSEMASACRQVGLDVTVIQRGPAPLASALGSTIAATVTRIQRDNGIDIRCNASVEKLEGDMFGHFRKAHLTDGTIVEADIAIVALGAIPNTEWLAGSGIGAGPSGVTCDTSCRAFGEDMMVLDDIYAAGDVARFPHPSVPDGFLALEHWENAVDMARIAAHNMTCEPGNRRAHLPIPAFWSSQFETNIKSLGILNAADQVVISQGSLETGEFIAVYGKGNRTVGAVSFNRGRNLPGYLRIIAEAAEFPPKMRVSEPPGYAGVMPAGFARTSASKERVHAVITGYGGPKRAISWVAPADHHTKN